MFFTYYRVLAYTKTVSSILTLEQIAPTRSLVESQKHVHRCYIQNYCTQLQQTPFHDFSVSLSYLVCLSLGPFTTICSTYRSFNRTDRTAIEEKYRASLASVQKLHLPDENTAVS